MYIKDKFVCPARENRERGELESKERILTNQRQVEQYGANFY
jgi:hypothetical protein